MKKIQLLLCIITTILLAQESLDLVASYYGEGAVKAPFWEEFENIRDSKNRQRYNTLKVSQDPYEKVLAAYLCSHFDDVQFLEACLDDNRVVNTAVGCIITVSSVGEIAFSLMVDLDKSDSLYFEKEFLQDLSINIMKNHRRVHLYDIAGKVLSSKLQLPQDDSLAFTILSNLYTNRMSNFSSFAVGAIITSVDVYHLQTPYRRYHNKFKNSKDINRDVIIRFIQSDIVNSEVKKYLVQFLYTNYVTKEHGLEIHNAVKKLKDTALREYEEELYKAYTTYKPIYFDLEQIKTWREMDKNRKEISILFTATNPIMIHDINGFFPSTVSESRRLKKEKESCLLELLTQCVTSNDDYFKFLAYKFLSQFDDALHRENGNDVFYEQIKIDEDTIRSYRTQLERNE